MSFLFTYLRLSLLILFVTVLSALNPGLFPDGSAINGFGDLEEPDQVFGDSYDSLLLAASPPSEPPTDSWTNPPAEPIHIPEIAIQQERLIANGVPPQEAARPNRGNDGIWHFNRSPLPPDSTNSCPTGFQPLGKRQLCCADSAGEWTQPHSPYNPDINFLLTLPQYPPSEHREPCGLFSGAPRWAICDSANPKDQYPAGITIAKATLFNGFVGCFNPHHIWCCYFFYITDPRQQTGVGNFCDLYTTISH